MFQKAPRKSTSSFADFGGFNLPHLLFENLMDWNTR